MKMLWCISCESWELVHGLRTGSTVSPFHAKITGHIGEPMEIDACDGPFATAEPPVMSEEEWDSAFDNEPDPAEMMLIDENNEHLVEY